MESVIQIQGMHCGGCVASVDKALRALDGVETATVELAGGRAIVRFDPARIDLRAIKSAIEAIGYDVVE